MRVRLAKDRVVLEDLSKFEGFIGQDSVIKKVTFFVESNSNDTPFPTLLFSGSHGLGKTFLAEKVSKVLDRDFISVNCGSIKKREEFITEVLMNIREPTTVFLDESHGLSKELTTILLSLLNPTDLHENIVRFKEVDFIYDMRLINMIFATTDAHAMFRPLKNRCYEVYFSPYDKKNLIGILRHYLGNIELSCDLDDLSDACRSRARDAYLLSQNIKRYVTLKDTRIVTERDWINIKNIFDIYPMGLKKEEVKLLDIINDSGPISCQNLALRLMVNEENVKSGLEVRLRELGFIESTSKGRQITSEGLRYFEKINLDL